MRLSVWIVTILCLVSCGRSPMQSHLESVESSLDQAPDSALMALLQIDTATIKGDRQRAFYKLLLAESEYRNYIDETDDRLLEDAIAFFQRKGDRNRLMRALFQQSTIQFNISDLSHSMVSALRAKEIAESLNDVVYMAKICEHISDIYNLSYNGAEEFKYMSLAAHYYKLAGKNLNFAYSTIDKSRSLWNMGNAKESLILLDSIGPHLSKSDSTLQRYFYESRIKPNMSLGLVDEAKESLDSLLCYSGSDYSVDLAIPLEISLAEKEFVTAKKIMESMLSHATDVDSDAMLLLALYHYYKAKGEHANALSHYEKLMHIQNETVKHTLAESVVKAQSEYFASSALSAKRHADEIRLWWLISIAVAVIVIIGSIVYYRWKIKRKIIEVEKKMDEIDNLSYTIRTRDESLLSLNKTVEKRDSQLLELSRRIDCDRQTISVMEDKVNNLYRAQFNTINELCNDYFAKKDASDKVKLSIFKEVEAQILKLRDKQNLQELEKSLDEYNNGIASKLYQCFPEMKRIDKTFLILTFAGLSSKAICIICDITIGNYYNKRQRLKAKIEASESPYKQLFIDKMR